ncbi:MAG: protein-L-isoaspartate(D-aspartate) O-methyltransferase [Acidobacteria bacterium]|nr:protein-L-isoaspartate(D-aspartate) O-methyltransferase [Acidobacteriota bacterium]MBV9144504.1 protein-L-isoaspartate(D-aspartate) O-methyltransferase [Acidobacteriota bacterium]MBV9436788.1 protein-L-isoaspartate(D-aspartate) O-methyltransferase [Acidobacteriota bacterium]
MIERQLKRRGIHDERVLAAMAKVPRAEFVSPEVREQAYEDRPLTIACGQTISQPYIVAYMLQAAELHPEGRVLEIGTGSGYQTALLAEIVREVISIERHVELSKSAEQRLTYLGYINVQLVIGDGTLGYLPRAPYDAILVSAAAPEAPRALLEQLALGGRMVLPIGNRDLQDLVLVRKEERGMSQIRLEGCAFVPLIGAAGFPE